MGVEPPKVPILGKQRAAKQENRWTMGSLSPSLSGWGSISPSTSPEPDVSGRTVVKGASLAAVGTSPERPAAEPPRSKRTAKRKENRLSDATLSLQARQPDFSRRPVGTRPVAADARLFLPVTGEPQSASSREVDERERRARRHKKELRLARQHKQRKQLSQPAAIIPSPRMGLCIVASNDPDVNPVSGHKPSTDGSAVGRAKKRPPNVLWVDRCAGLAHGMTAEVSAAQSALGRVGLIVRRFSDEQSALSWATHHASQVACAVLHLQLAECKRADQILIEKCAALKVPTLVLQLVPAGFEPSDTVRRAMEERAALCRRLDVPVASELPKAQATILEEVSRKYEFAPNGQLQRLPTPKDEMPPWRPPRGDNGDKMPPINGAAPATPASEPCSKVGAQRRGNKHQYHLAPSSRGAGAVRSVGQSILIV